MDEITITRQELYDLVWKESLTAVSKRLNIPYSHLRKVCTEMQVPVPRNGHWSRLQIGKTVEVVELPLDYSGVSEIKLYPDEKDIYDPSVLTFYKKTAIDLIKEDKTLQLTVPKKLTNPNEMVKTTQKRLTEYKYSRYNDHGMVRSEEVALNIRVSRSNIGRALRFMDTLIKLLRARGHTLIIKFQRVYSVIDGEEFEFSLMEKGKKLPPNPKGGFAKYEPTGIFYFTIKGNYGRIWTDGKVPIEKKLAEILAKLEAIAKREKEDRRHQEEHLRKLEEQERIIREQQQRIEKEKSDFKDLYQQAKRWQRSRFMREYLNAFEENATEKGWLIGRIPKLDKMGKGESGLV